MDLKNLPIQKEEKVSLVYLYKKISHIHIKQFQIFQIWSEM